MSFETDVLAKYGVGALATRMWWDTVPDGVPAASREAPFCVINEVGGNRRQYIDNSEPEFLNSTLQFNVWGKSREAVGAAARVLCSNILASTTDVWIVTTIGAPVGDYNEVLKLAGSRVDASFWFPNPAYVPDP